MRAQVAIDRRTGGRFPSRTAGMRQPLLSTTERKTGQPCTVPVGYFELDGMRFVVATNGDAAPHPVWYLNLVAQPEVRVGLGRSLYITIARTTTGDERPRMLTSRIWRRSTSAMRVRHARFPRVMLSPVQC